MRVLIAVLALVGLVGCSGGSIFPAALVGEPSGGTYKVGGPYVIDGRRYEPGEQPGYSEVGLASWYGPAFHGKPTANGEVFDQNAVTAAHKTLPLPSRVRVTNLENNRELVVRVNDRGPFVGDRIIDLSRRSAQLLDIERAGIGTVRVDLIDSGPHLVGANPPLPDPDQESHVLAKTRRASEDTTLFVQLGSYRFPENAQDARREFAQYGSVQVVEHEMRGAVYHRVRLGPFASARAADDAVIRLRREGRDPSIFVVQIPRESSAGSP